MGQAEQQVVQARRSWARILTIVLAVVSSVWTRGLDLNLLARPMIANWTKCVALYEGMSTTMGHLIEISMPAESQSSHNLNAQGSDCRFEEMDSTQ